jgi:hypothetical protein
MDSILYRAFQVADPGRQLAVVNSNPPHSFLMRISLCLEQEYELLRSKLSLGLGQLIRVSPIFSGFLFQVGLISIFGVFGGAISLAILAPTPVGAPFATIAIAV